MDDFLTTRAKSLTHPGRKRPNNEDFVDFYEPAEPDDVLSSGSLYIVADGVGGAAYGERASKYAVQKVLHDYYQPSQLSPAQRLEQAMLAANADIHGYSRSEEVSAQMATTIVAALVYHNQLVVANVGDSPAYLIRAGQIRQLSRDHSLVGERVRDGSMTEEEARNSRIKNQLTRSLGGEADVVVDVMQPVPLMPGDRIVLCTDGVTRYASRQQIFQMANSGTPEEAANRLVDYANQEGGADNITALVILIETHAATDATISVGVPHRPSVTSLSDMDTYTPGTSPRRRAAPLTMAGPSRRYLGKLPIQSWMFLGGLVVVTLAVVAMAAMAFAQPPAALVPITQSFATATVNSVTKTGSATQLALLSTPIPLPTGTTARATDSATPAASTSPSPAQSTQTVAATQSVRITGIPPTSVAGSEYCVYKVEQNATLGAIAQIFGKLSTDIESYFESCTSPAGNQSPFTCFNLKNFKNEKEKDNIKPGQWLVIPIDAKTCQAPVQPASPTPTVAPGKIYIFTP